jgi:hypothetical protein
MALCTNNIVFKLQNIILTYDYVQNMEIKNDILDALDLKV